MTTLDSEEERQIEARVAAEGPSMAVAYLFWAFIGVVSAHRFYLHRPGTAIFQIILLLLVVGIIWWVIDAFLIPSMVRDERETIRRRLLAEAVTQKRRLARAP